MTLHRTTSSRRRADRHITLLFAYASCVTLWLMSCTLCVSYGNGISWSVLLANGGIGVAWGEEPDWPKCRYYNFGLGFNCEYNSTVIDNPRVLPTVLTVDQYYAAWVPLWPLALIAVPLALREIVHMRRQTSWGGCRKCGYDLRGLPTPRCPECGTSIPEQLRHDIEKN